MVLRNPRRRRGLPLVALIVATVVLALGLPATPGSAAGGASVLAWEVLPAFPDPVASHSQPVTELVCPSALTCAALGTLAGGSGETVFFLVTTDGGKSWTDRPSLPFAAGANSEACPSTTTCYVVGAAGLNAQAVYKTTDLGQSWTTLSVPPETGAIDSVVFNGTESRIVCPSTTMCIAFGAFLPVPATEGFLATTDGGAHWQPFLTSLVPVDNSFGDLVCPTTSTCYFAFGQSSSPGSASIIRSQDAGQTWQAMASPPGSLTWDFGSLTCPTATTCYIEGNATSPPPSPPTAAVRVDRTTDGGATWTGPSLLRSNAAPDGMSCASASTCYAPFVAAVAGEGDGVLATTDGWVTSTVEPLPAGVIPGHDQGGALYGPLLACPVFGVCYQSGIVFGGTASPLGYRSLLLTGVPDTVAPSVAVAKLPVGVTSSSVRVNWTGADAGSGVASYDVRYERAAFNGGFGPWVSPAGLQATRATSTRLGLAPGFDYCVEIRARDHAGNLSGWFGPRCVARALDDRSLTTGSGWVRRAGSGYYFHTFTSTTKNRVVLTRRGARLDRLGIVATRCASCGTVRVFVGSRLIGTINLTRSVTRKEQLLMLPRFTFRTGAITIKTLTSGKTIEIDGLVVSRT